MTCKMGSVIKVYIVYFFNANRGLICKKEYFAGSKKYALKLSDYEFKLCGGKTRICLEKEDASQLAVLFAC